MENNLGTHIILDVFGCEFDKLNDKDFLVDLFDRAVKEANMTCLNTFVHCFYPQGISITMALQESHITIHSFPEISSATIDCYTCYSGQPMLAIDLILSELKPKRKNLTSVTRGIDR